MSGVSKMGLGEQLRAAIQRGASSSDKGFIPLDQIDAIINRESIKEEILQTPDLLVLFAEYGDALIDNILGLDSQVENGSRKIRLFAILALIGCVNKIVNFLDKSTTDEILPISLEHGPTGDSPNIVAKDKITSLAPYFNTWDRSTIEDFEKQQWVVLAPVFGRDVPFLNLPPKAILPFIEDEDYGHRRGGTSKIFRVKIHPSHLIADSKEPLLSFAVKRVRSVEKDSFCRELKALRRFSSRGVPQHPNILEFLSAWQQDGHFNLIFPWALSDLAEWWRNNPLPAYGPGDKTTLWLANQALDIASGLSAVHQFLGSSDPSIFGYAGHHGDIKPGNILWFPDPENPDGPGTWKISDFGLSGVGSHPSLAATERLGCTPAYRAPEYDAPDHVITMAFDVWSLGCVLLECLTWSLIGLKGIKELEAWRLRTGTSPDNEKGDSAFWEVVKQGNEMAGKAQSAVKAPVKKWMDMLRKHGKDQSPSVSAYVEELSALIEKRMLVVDDQQRSPSSDIAGELRHMRDRLSQEKESSRLELPSLYVGFEQPKDLTTEDATTFGSVEPATFFPQTLPAPDASVSVLEESPCAMSSLDLLTMIDNDPYHSMPGIVDSGVSTSQDWSSFDGFAPTVLESARSDGYATEPAPRRNCSLVAADTVATCGSKRHRDDIIDREVQGATNKHRKLEPAGPSCHSTGPPIASKKMEAKRQPASPTNKSTVANDLRFACPFHKHDPKTFGIHEPRWRTCAGPGWTTIHRLKEHIDRKHSAQPNTCSRCLTAFPSPYDLGQHQKSETPCEANQEHCYRVTEAQRALMRKRPRGRSEVGAWNDIYRIIFGLSDKDAVPWPYHETTVSPDEDSPKSTSQPESSSLNEFEEYLTQSVIPNANEETMVKIQGYLDLVRQFRGSGTQSTSQLADETVLSSVPSLVSDNFSQMAHSQASNDPLMELSAVDPPMIYNPSMTGADISNEIPACGSLAAWNPNGLTMEEEEMSRILFKDLDSHGSSLDWQQAFTNSV